MLTLKFNTCKAPAASWRPGRCELSERNARSISADVDGAHAIAELGQHRARHITSVAIAATDVADAEVVMMIAPAAPPSATAAPRLRGSGGGSQRHCAQSSCGNNSKSEFT